MIESALLYESHSHTPLCKHAYGHPRQYAATAAAKNLRGLIVTCHNPMPDGFSANVRMGLDEFDKYVRLVEETRTEYVGRVDIRLGLEADYFPGYEDFLEKQLASAEFHYVLGSVHPQTQEYRERYWTGNPIEYQHAYFQSLADAAETKLFDCLAHPDLVKNETVESWNPEMIWEQICQALDRIAAVGVAMEINTSGMNKRIPEMNPFPQMLVEMKKRDIPVVLGADAHVPERVADGYEKALSILESCGYDRIQFFLERKPHEVTIQAARQSLLERSTEIVSENK
ncbi:MAG: histidinol-phosphatase [Pirellulaceae bacterium]|nr:histidinol-phosphatase [Pirellulaceae bacterium]